MLSCRLVRIYALYLTRGLVDDMIGVVGTSGVNLEV